MYKAALMNNYLLILAWEYCGTCNKWKNYDSTKFEELIEIVIKNVRVKAMIMVKNIFQSREARI